MSAEDNKAALAAAWKQAHENPGTPVELGRIVVCDICNEDCTESKEVGGFIFGSKAYCPKCAAEALPRIREYNKEHFIRARCPDAVAFADFVRGYRGSNNSVSVQTL